MFLLLAGDHCYPRGCLDIVGKYQTIEEAIARLKQDKKNDEERPKSKYFNVYKYEWYEIFDIDKMKIVRSGCYIKDINHE